MPTDNTPLPTSSAPTDLIAIKASPEEVAAIVYPVAYNKPLIQDFLDNFQIQDVIAIAAWFEGMVVTQKPELAPAFEDARRVGRDVATVLFDVYKRETGAMDNSDIIQMIFPPAPPVAPTTINSPATSNLVQ